MWRRAVARELARGLPGTNTQQANRRMWTLYDWEQGGEEWTVSPQWRQALIEEVMFANLPADATTLEIGPGAGRWSVALQRASRELILVDLSETAIELCRRRLAQFHNVSFHLTDGATLPLPASSVDFVWSFDVFVHIAPRDQQTYLVELARVMRPGAQAIIHHAGRGSVHREAWRSGMSAERFVDLVQAAGMCVITQFDRWGPNHEFAVPESGDVITVFAR